MNNLPEIKDIHIPDGVSIFPLAYGWWIIIAIVILALLTIKILFWIYKTSRKYYAIKQIKKLNDKTPVETAIDLSNLLRRVCNYKYKNASTLYGEEWINFLNEHSEKKLSKDEACLLLYAPFIDKNNHNINISAINNLKEFCSFWVRENL